jgi:hypothetical protein
MVALHSLSFIIDSKNMYENKLCFKLLNFMKVIFVWNKV